MHKLNAVHEPIFCDFMTYILVVEDDPEINALMALTLRVEDYEVAQARDGQQALRMVLERLPDLILLDVMMPRLSGYEVARVLQRDPITRHIPLIFVTAKSDMEDRARGLELANDYVCKPFAAPELIARVRAALRMSKLQEQLRATNEKLAQLATTDSLTGLCNRRHFYLELEDEIQRARRFEQPISVVLFDLDHFKQINDLWGHAQSDLVLQQCARVLESARRSIDTVARLGGEEFAALLPATGLEGACAFAEKVRRAIETMSVSCFDLNGEATGDIHVTVSAGAAVATQLEPPPENESEIAPLPNVVFNALNETNVDGAMENSVSGDQKPTSTQPTTERALKAAEHETKTSETQSAGSASLPTGTQVDSDIADSDIADSGINVETVSVRSSVRRAIQKAALRAVQSPEEKQHDLLDTDARLSPEGQELMRIADRLLYQSKLSGRNRTTTEVVFGAPGKHTFLPPSGPVSEAARL